MTEERERPVPCNDGQAQPVPSGGTESKVSVPRIYVASLSDYNAGRLHGVWIDLDDGTDVDTVWGTVNTMLAKSPEFKAFPLGGPAEEWAIHDYEGFYGVRLFEWESFGSVVKLAGLLREHGGAFAAWYANEDRDVDDDWAEQFEGEFRGEWESLAEYAEDFYDSCYDKPDGLDQWPLTYIDWERAGRDLEIGGDVWTVRTPDFRVWVFGL